MTSIFTQIEAIGEDVIHTIVTEAKQIAAGAYALAKPFVESAIQYAKEAGSAALDNFISFIKETSLGTAIMNLISAASSSTASGYDKFAAVLLAAQNAWSAFIGNGGLSGVWSVFKSALTYVVQKLYENFAATFLKVA